MPHKFDIVIGFELKLNLLSNNPLIPNSLGWYAWARIHYGGTKFQKFSKEMFFVNHKMRVSKKRKLQKNTIKFLRIVAAIIFYDHEKFQDATSN